MGVLLRQLRWPRLFAAVVTAALILGTAAATGPLFLSSASNAVLIDELALLGDYDAGLTARMYGFVHRRLFDRAEAALFREITPIDELGTPTATALGASVAVRRPGSDDEARLRLFYRDRALRNVTRLRGHISAPGVWIDDNSAAFTGVDVGDTVVVGYGNGRARVPIAGIYRSLAAQPLSPYWRPLMFEIINPRSNDLAPPPFLIADKDTFFEVGRGLGESAELVWHFPLADRDLDYERAQALEVRYDRAHRAPDDPLSPLGRAVRALQVYAFQEPSIDSLFFSSMERIRSTRATLDASMRIVTTAGQAVALLAMAGAGVFVARRRRTELRLLLAQGISPAGIGARFAAEAIVPILIGVAGGGALAQALVAVLGPSSTFDRTAVLDAVTGMAVAALAAVVVTGVVVGVSARREIEIGFARVRRLLGRTPWELVVLLLAGAAYYEISRGRGAVVTSPDDVPQVDLFVLAFPLLLMGGIAGLCVRGVRHALPLLKGAGSTFPMPLYLAWRRLSSASNVTMMLVALTALTVGVLMYAAILVDSIEATVHAKAHVATGSDVAVTVTQQTETPAAPFPVTRVTRTNGELLPGDVEVDVLGIDPKTFAGAAYWDDSFSTRSLGELVGALREPGDRLPILVSGVQATTGDITLRAADTEIPAEVIDVPRAFPGMTLNTPVVVADRGAFETVVSEAGAGSVISVVGRPEIWAKGDPASIHSYLDDRSLITGSVRDVRAFQEVGDLRAVTWTFGLIQALGYMAAGIALVGLLFYLETRQREREAAYGLARRMGLARGTHRLAVVIEIAGMLAVAVAVGEISAFVASKLVLAHADPLPEMPPAALFRLPAGLALGLLPLGLLIAIVGAWRVQRAADKARMAEVMRVAT